MARITQPEAAAWGEPSKMGVALAALDNALLNQLEGEIIARIEGFGYDVSTWTDSSNTPAIVKTIITKTYVSWIYDRTYSEDEDANVYAARLMANAESLMLGLQTGDIPLPGVPEVGMPSFYPNDASSAQRPTSQDPSLGPAAFSMGQVF